MIVVAVFDVEVVTLACPRARSSTSDEPIRSHTLRLTFSCRSTSSSRAERHFLGANKERHISDRWLGYGQSAAWRGQVCHVGRLGRGHFDADGNP